ncbi:STAS domain-containing protein [Streptomyces daliensis]
MATWHPGEQIRRYSLGRTLVVELSGEIDLVVAPAGADFLQGTDLGSEPEVVADLRKVTFIDASGLGGLHRLYRRLRADDRRLLIVTADPFVRRLIDIAGLTALIPVEERMPAAHTCSGADAAPQRAPGPTRAR